MLDTTLQPSSSPIETWTLTPEQLKSQFDRLGCGDVIVYAVGDLGHERQTAKGQKGANANQSAELAYTLSKQGKAQMTQKRLAPNKYEYWLTRV